MQSISIDSDVPDVPAFQPKNMLLHLVASFFVLFLVWHHSILYLKLIY